MLSELHCNGNETPIGFAFNLSTLTECLKFPEKLQGRLTRPQQESMDRGSGPPLIIPSASRC